MQLAPDSIEGVGILFILDMQLAPDFMEGVYSKEANISQGVPFLSRTFETGMLGISLCEASLST
jgi:hypothetical protein